MKKIFILAVFISLICYLPAIGLKQVGPMVGMNYSTLTSDDFSNSDAKSGIVAGAYFIFGLTPFADIEVDVLYTDKSSEKTIKSIDLEEKEEYTLQYLDVPVLFKRKLPIPGPITPSIFAGPVFSVLINDDYDYKNSLDKNLSKAVDVEFKNNDFSLLVGASLEVFKFHIDARYSFGLVDVIDSKIVKDIVNESKINPNFKNNSLNINIGYSFF